MADKVIFRFLETGEEVAVEACAQLNLLAHAQIVERSLQSRCGGHCECSTCRVRLLSGRLSALREPERQLLDRVRANHDGIRLSCQSFPEPGEDVVIEVPNRKFADVRN